MSAAAVWCSLVLSLAEPPFFDTSGRFQRGVKTGASTFYTAVHDGKSLVHHDAAWRPALLSFAEAEDALASDGSVAAFLGSVDEHSDSPLAAGDYWLLETSHLPEPPALLDGAVWEPLRASAGPSVCDDLENDEAALLATARGMAHWHRSVKFCASCGSGDIETYRDGKGRRCTACGTRFRPRLDPSVIVLVTDSTGERCLLGRNKRWPAGRYSTLAGFCEFGETLEETVVREISEEAGVTVARDSIEFVASQPWLFPRSLMVGFTCKVVEPADDAALTVDANELEDAKWFDKEFVRQALTEEREAGKDGPAEEGGFHVPSRVSLARTLIQNWLDSP